MIYGLNDIITYLIDYKYLVLYKLNKTNDSAKFVALNFLRKSFVWPL